MIQRIVTLTAIFLFSLNTHFGAAQEKSYTKHIEVDSQLQENFERFRCIMVDYNINIDWSNLNAVSLIPLRYGVQGFWVRKGKVASINYFYQFPPYIPLTKEQRNDFILLTLAHEIGHGQGFQHSVENVDDLMAATSKYDFSVVLGKRVEQYIADYYLEHLN